MAFKNIHVMLTGNATSLKTAMSSAGRSVDNFDRKVDKVGGRLGKTKMALAAVGTAAAAMAVTGLAVGVKKAIEFEREMRNVNTIAKQSEDAFAAMKEEVLDLSTRVPQSANVLAQGLYDISSAGFAGAAGLEVLEASAVAAAAGMTTTDVSAKGVTAVLNAYGLAASEAGDVSDIMFKTVEQGVITFEELSAEVGDIVGIGAAAGLSFDQLASAMAAITKAGVPAAQASTSLARLVQGFIDPADELAVILEKWGYESGTAALQQEGLHDIMQRVRQETGGNAEELLKLFPQIRATRAAFALMANEGENYAGTAENIEEQNNRLGASQDALNEQSKSLAFQWDMLTSSMSAGAIRAGELVVPALNSMIQGAARMADQGFPALMSAIDNLAPLWEDLADIGMDVVDVFGDLWEIAGPIVDLLAKATFGTIVGSLKILASTVSTVTGFFADNEAAVYAVATVLVAMLVPAISALITRLQVMLVMGVVNALGAMGTAAASASGGFAALAASAGVANLALAAVAVGIGVAIIESKRLREEMDALAQSQADAFGQEFSIDSNVGRIERWRAQIEGTREELERLGDIQQQAVDPLSFETGADMEGYLQSLSLGLSKALPFFTSQAEVDWEQFLAMDELTGEMQDQALNALGNINAAMRGIREELGKDLSMEAIGELADTLGIDLATAARDEAVPALIEAAAAAQAGEGDYANATTAVDELATAHDRATEALKEYIDEQRAMFDPLFAAQDAFMDLAEAQEAADEALKEHGEDSDEFAEASRDVASSIMDQEGALRDLKAGLDDGSVSLEGAVEMLDRWASSGDLSAESTAVLRQMIENLISSGEDWADDTYDAVLTADEQQALDAFNGVITRANEWDGWMAQADILADNSNALYGIDVARRELGRIDGSRANMYVDVQMSAADQAMLNSARASGYADGGIVQFADGSEDHRAQIAPPGAWRVWAEPETGGEAYIPLAAAKRDRSMAILRDVADRFGQALIPNRAGQVYAGTPQERAMKSRAAGNGPLIGQVVQSEGQSESQFAAELAWRAGL